MNVTAETLSEYELERGKPMPSWNHGIVQANIIGEVAKDRRFRGVSELNLDLGMKPDLVPDVCVFLRKPVDFSHDDIRVSEPPLIAVEIMSPQQRSFEIFRKVDRYLGHGVKSCWVVDPALHTVKIIEASGRESVFTEGVVTDPATGIQVDLDAVFS